MTTKNRKGLLLAGPALALAVLACGLLDSATPPPTPTTEFIEVAQPEATPAWAPELLYRLESQSDQPAITINRVAFTPDGKYVASGVLMEAEVWDMTGGSLARSLKVQHSVDDLAFSPDGSLLGVGLGVGGVSLLEFEDGAELRKLHSGYDNRLAFSPNGETVATGNREGVVWIWRVADGEKLAEFELPEPEYIVNLAFSPDGETLAALDFSCRAILWDLESGQHLHTLEGNSSSCYMNNFAFSPDGELLAVTGLMSEDFKRIQRLWRVADGSVFLDIQLPADSYGVDFSPDGRLLAVGHREGTGLWQLPEGDHLYTLDQEFDPEESDWITSVSFSPNGNLLAVGRWNGILEVWKVRP